MKRRSKKKANQRRSDSLKGKERRTWCERERARACVRPLEAWQKESICVCVCACGRERRRVGEQNCNFSFFPFQRFESPILERRHTATHVRGAKPRPIPCQKIGRGTKKSFISLSRHLSLSLSHTHTSTFKKKRLALTLIHFFLFSIWKPIKSWIDDQAKWKRKEFGQTKTKTKIENLELSIFLSTFREKYFPTV